jgi:hypothetical protein
MSAGDSRPLPRSEEKTWVSRSESVSNTLQGYRPARAEAFRQRNGPRRLTFSVIPNAGG